MDDKPVQTEAHCDACSQQRTFRLDVVSLDTYTCAVCGEEEVAEEVLDSSDPTPAVVPVDDDDDDYPPIMPI